MTTSLSVTTQSATWTSLASRQVVSSSMPSRGGRTEHAEGGGNRPRPAATVERTDSAASPSLASTSASAPRLSVEERAERLVQALDRDGDGSLTREEFTDGARDLLRAARRHHPRGRREHVETGEDEHNSFHARSLEGYHRGRRRLEARLGDVFDAVDTDNSGLMTAGEVAAALAKATSPTPTPAPPPTLTPVQTAPPAPSTMPAPVAEPLPTPTAPPVPEERAYAVTVTSVRYVSIAIQRYQVMAQSA